MCYHPRTIYDRFLKVSYQVPCGKCVACLKSYQNSIKVRLGEELKFHKYVGVFFTLTYARDTAHAVTDAVDHDTGEYFGSSDDYSDITPRGVERDHHRILEVNKRDIQLWLKRSRERMYQSTGKRKYFTYYITSEYGTRTLRPHAHGVLCGITEQEFQRYFLPDWSSHIILKRYKHPACYTNVSHNVNLFDSVVSRVLLNPDDYYWKFVNNKNFKGHIDYEAIKFTDKKSPGRCADYISKYCSKGMFENPRVKRGYVAKTFHLMSKKLGISWVYENRHLVTQGYKECAIEYNPEKVPFLKKQRQDVYFGLLHKKQDFHDTLTFSYYTGVRRLSSQFIPDMQQVRNSYYTHIFDIPKVFKTDLLFLRKDGKFGHPIVKPYKCITRTSFRNKIYALIPKMSYVLDLAINRLTIGYYDKEKDITFHYKLPRYYYDKLFPQDSPLRKRLQEALQILADRVHSAKLAKLQTQVPGLSLAQATSQVYLSDLHQAEQRERKETDILKRFYDRSIF